MSREEGLRYGLLASIAAFIIIEYLLIQVFLYGVYTPYAWPNIMLISSLIPIGLVAYMGYLSWLVEGRDVFKYASALALLLGSASIATGYMGEPVSLYLLFTAYFTEVVVGPFLMRGFETYDWLGARLFLVGILGFVFSLPLVSLANEFALIPFSANLLKGYGLIRIYLKTVEKQITVEEAVEAVA